MTCVRALGSIVFLVPSLAFAQVAPESAQASPSAEGDSSSPSAPNEPLSEPPQPVVAAPVDSEPSNSPVSVTAAELPAAASGDKPAEPVKEDKPPIEWSAAPGQGFTVKAGDKFSMNLKARVQIRYQITDPSGPAEPQQTVNLGTLRVGLNGNIFTPNLQYLIQLALAGRDYRDGSTSPVYDAFLDWKAHRDISIKVGQYFVPFDRLRTVREFALQMADRPRPVNELTLDRDVGVTFYSDKFLGDDSPIAYRLGVFGGGGINLTNGRDPGVLAVGRLEFRPFGAVDDDSEGDLERRHNPGLAIGVAGATNFNSDRLRSTTGPTFVGGTTDYYHGAVDMVFKWRGFAFQAEGLYKEAADDAIESEDADGNEVIEATRSGYGWITQASYVFPVPFEVVGRLSGLYAMDGTDPTFVAETETRGQEVAAGVNYYFNKHRFKLQADWIARMPHDFDFSVAENTGHVQVDVTF